MKYLVSGRREGRRKAAGAISTTTGQTTPSGAALVGANDAAFCVGATAATAGGRAVDTAALVRGCLGRSRRLMRWGSIGCKRKGEKNKEGRRLIKE
jgi:hypothetical protein